MITFVQMTVQSNKRNIKQELLKHNISDSQKVSERTENQVMRTSICTTV